VGAAAHACLINGPAQPWQQLLLLLLLLLLRIC
jgi:hypothetical protein